MKTTISQLADALRIPLFGAFMAAVLASCAASGDRAATPAESAESLAQEPPPAAGVAEVTAATPPEQDLSSELMFDILLGEIAGQRGILMVSVPHYLQAAMEAQDPRVAERALQIASFANAYDEAERAARRWVELDPDSVEARKAMIALALHQDDDDEVIEHLNHLLSISDDPEEGYGLATTILAREEDKTRAMNTMQQLVDLNPDNPYAWMAMSRIAATSDDNERAMQAVDKALSLSPNHPDALLLKAQILVRQERNDEARTLLARAVKKHPEDTSLRFAYGRMLLDGDDLEGAREQFAQVVEIEPDNRDGLYSLALLELETGRYADGEAHLQRLLEIDPGIQNAYYYLGYSSLKQGKDDEALAWYSKVESGDYWSQAQLRMAEILVRQGNVETMQGRMRVLRQKDPTQSVTYYLLEGQVLSDAGLHDEAYALYSDALEASPDNPDLLYAHSLAAERLGKLDVAERNMRQILEKDPDNVRTLNALGYTLADRTTRYEEALGYIKRAYEQEPNDPAIIDSLGWVNYRLGNLEEARRLLQQAWDMTKDGEIGAHLGEVMWEQGDQDEARAIWEASREIAPDNPVLLDAINRYNP